MTSARSASVAIAQGGGPTAVINASLYGLVAETIGSMGDRAPIWGLLGGVTGALEDRWLDLRRTSSEQWRAIAAAPGAALGSCRKRLDDEEADAVLAALRCKEVRFFFYVGGNDSMDTALKVSRAALKAAYELHVVGIPKTIDNDLPKTDHCPGFGSAARYIAQALIDLGTDVRALPTPVSIIETMGRNAGWLVAATMAARRDPDDAPHLVYTPEFPLSAERFLDDVREVHERWGRVVVAVSEGIRDENGNSWSLPREETVRDGFGHVLPGDSAAVLARLVTSRLKLRARSEKPGLCGRASSLLASEVDRREAEEVGRFGLRRAAEGRSGFMVSIERLADGYDYRVGYGTVPLEEVANVERLFPAGYVNARRNHIEESYRAYLEPLLGGPLQRYARLDAGS